MKEPLIRYASLLCCSCERGACQPDPSGKATWAGRHRRRLSRIGWRYDIPLFNFGKRPATRQAAIQGLKPGERASAWESRVRLPPILKSAAGYTTNPGCWFSWKMGSGWVYALAFLDSLATARAFLRVACTPCSGEAPGGKGTVYEEAFQQAHSAERGYWLYHRRERWIRWCRCCPGASKAIPGKPFWLKEAIPLLCPI